MFYPQVFVEFIFKHFTPDARTALAHSWNDAKEDTVKLHKMKHGPRKLNILGYISLMPKNVSVILTKKRQNIIELPMLFLGNLVKPITRVWHCSGGASFWDKPGHSRARWSRDGAHYNLLNIVSVALLIICAITVRAGFRHTKHVHVHSDPTNKGPPPRSKKVKGKVKKGKQGHNKK